MPTSKPFWKEPTDIYQMHTRRSTKKGQLIHGPKKYVEKFTNNQHF